MMNLAETHGSRNGRRSRGEATVLGNGGTSWKVDKPRASGFKSDRDRQAGRQMARERESGGQTAREADRQPGREGSCQPAREGQTGSGHHNRTTQVEGPAAARRHEGTRKPKEQGQVLTGWGVGWGVMDRESELGRLSGPLAETGAWACTGRHLQLRMMTRGGQRCLALVRARHRRHALRSVAHTQAETAFSVLG